MLRLMSESMPDARFSSIWRASSSSPRRMSSITLAQIAEKPITVATDEMISNFADSRQGRPATPCAIRIAWFAPDSLNAPGIVAAGLNGDSDALMG